MVVVVNVMFKLVKDLKVMLLIIVSGSEDVVERVDELDVLGILK